MSYRTELTFQMYHPSTEAAIVLVSNAPSAISKFGEVLLFSIYTLRQLSNLGWNPLSQMLASSLQEVHVQYEHSRKETAAREPHLVPFSGKSANKQILVTLDFDQNNAMLQINSRGYGKLWDMDMNADYAASALLLVAYLADHRPDDKDYLMALDAAAADCAGLHQIRENPIGRQAALGLAVTKRHLDVSLAPTRG